MAVAAGALQRQHGVAGGGTVMQLIALLVVLVVVGLLMGRMEGVFKPGPGPSATPEQTTRQVEKITDAASRADRQRLDDAMKALR